jgi:hypothetical protein
MYKASSFFRSASIPRVFSVDRGELIGSENDIMEFAQLLLCGLFKGDLIIFISDHNDQLVNEISKHLSDINIISITIGEAHTPAETFLLRENNVTMYKVSVYREYSYLLHVLARIVRGMHRPPRNAIIVFLASIAADLLNNISMLTQLSLGLREYKDVSLNINEIYVIHGEIPETTEEKYVLTQTIRLKPRYVKYLIPWLYAALEKTGPGYFEEIVIREAGKNKYGYPHS